MDKNWLDFGDLFSRSHESKILENACLHLVSWKKMNIFWLNLQRYFWDMDKRRLDFDGLDHNFQSHEVKERMTLACLRFIFWTNEGILTKLTYTCIYFWDMGKD